MIYSFIDLETTGLNNPVGSDQMIQVAILQSTGESFHTNVQLEPGKQLPEFITKLTGLTEKSLDASVAMSLSNVEAAIFDMLKGTIVVAQWAPFDLSFFPNLDIEGFYCTRTMTSLITPDQNPSLAPTCERLGIKLENAHTAMADCSATRELFFYYKEVLGDELHLYANMIIDTDKRPLHWLPTGARVVNLRGGDQNVDYVPINVLV